MKSLVAGHRGGRIEAMFWHVLFGELSLGTGVAIVLSVGGDKDIPDFALKDVKVCFQVER